MIDSVFRPVFRSVLPLAVFGLVLSASDRAAAQGTPPVDNAPFAGKTIDELTADEVLKLVRYSYTLYDQDFEGVLRTSITHKVPFLLSLKPDHIRFIFSDPAQAILVETKNRDFKLFEGEGGEKYAPVDASKYGEHVRGTDVTYDDLSMRFLYWPGARIVEEAKLKGRDTWLVRVRNPDGAGLYATVDCWIDKASGGMMKMMGYNRQGRPVRRFEVLHGKKFGDIWMVDDMRIETIDPGSGKVESSTRMQIKKER